MSTEGKYLKSVGVRGKDELQFDNPRGLDISTDKDRLYIADQRNNRIQCLNLDLSFHSFINNIPGAKDVKLTSEEIVILTSCNPCVSLYTYSHQSIRQLILCGEGNPLMNPCFFNLDASSNILITDVNYHSVCVFSFKGVFVHKFGKEGKERSDLIEPRGIAIDIQGNILVASKNPNHCLQVF